MFIIASGRSIVEKIEEYKTEYPEGIIFNYKIIISTMDENAIKYKTAGDAMRVAIIVNKQINTNTFQIYEIND